MCGLPPVIPDKKVIGEVYTSKTIKAAGGNPGWWGEVPWYSQGTLPEKALF
jgi:hypothetical protein